MKKATPVQSEAVKARRRMRGVVVSHSGKDTAVVEIKTKRLHALYNKLFTVTKKFHAHSVDNNIAVGTEVTIEETRPISKLKRWRIV